MALAYLSNCFAGLCSGLLDAIDRRRQVLVEDMRIAGRGPDIPVPEGLLHDPKVAAVAQERRREGVAEVMEPEVAQPRPCSRQLPAGVQAFERDRQALASDPPAPGSAQGKAGRLPLAGGLGVVKQRAVVVPQHLIEPRSLIVL